MYNYVNYIYERVKHVRELKFKINDKETKIYNLIIRKISTSPTFPFFIKYLMRITTISFFFRHTNKSKLHKKSTINVLVINSLKHGSMSTDIRQQTFDPAPSRRRAGLGLTILLMTLAQPSPRASHSPNRTGPGQTRL